MDKLGELKTRITDILDALNVDDLQMSELFSRLNTETVSASASFCATHLCAKRMLSTPVNRTFARKLQSLSRNCEVLSNQMSEMLLELRSEKNPVRRMELVANAPWLKDMEKIVDAVLR